MPGGRGVGVEPAAWAAVAMAKGLTNKQRVFVEAYLATWNATEAARQAGYAYPNVEGARLLVNPSIAETIKQRIAEKTMAADEVLVRLTEHARNSMQDFLDPDRGELDLASARDGGKLHLVKKLTRTDTKYGKQVAIELYDAQAALALLGKHHGLFKEVIDVQINPSELTDDQLARLAAGEDPAKVLRRG